MFFAELLECCLLYTSNRLNKAYYGGNIPWLKTGDLNDGYITHIPDVYKRQGNIRLAR